MSLSPKNIVNLKIPECIELADTSFHNGGPTDILLWATIFFEILCKNQILLGKDKPILQETLFGWIVAGSIQVQNQKQVTSLLCNEQELQDQLQLFWEIEEQYRNTRRRRMFKILQRNYYFKTNYNCFGKLKNSTETHEEEECLKYFNETTTRDETGQFVVKMPLKDNIEQLGDTYDVALRKFIALEKKLQVNPGLHKQYLTFMKEYEDLGHMTKTNDHNNETVYHLPHHPVVKTDSLTTKLRVVFDGSARPSNGLSLNVFK
ncbi:hypothetical protein QE152_g38316 [Popillia japonica]|uniref:Peptidase aspartic putative domain-containing protein n=1 Tax=Popillia japonica TaxID=7064 RepID=A0AAW1I8A0_POPJA